MAKPINNLEQKILNELKNPKCMNELKKFGKTKQVKAYLRNLKEKGFPISYKNGYYFLNINGNSPTNNTYKMDIPKYFIFGAIGDTHLASKYERLDLLNDMYDFFESEGVETIFHTGDLLQGVGIYSGEASDLKYFTLEDQINYAVENYPKRDNITTYTIAGNHDLKQFERGKSPNPIKIISQQRDDIKHMGDYYTKVLDKSNNISIDLLHPSFSSCYCIAYHGQKYIEKLTPGTEPDIILQGHTHDTLYMFYRGVHYLKTGTFQDQNPFSLRKGLISILGGWLVEIKHNGEEIEEFKPLLKTYSF